MPASPSPIARSIQPSIFITGHDASGLVPDSVDWESFSRGAPVLVIYMALKHIEPIVERLLAAGRSPAESIAVVGKATTAEQVLESTLGKIVTDLAGVGIEPPPWSWWARQCGCGRA